MKYLPTSRNLRNPPYQQASKFHWKTCLRRVGTCSLTRDQKAQVCCFFSTRLMFRGMKPKCTLTDTSEECLEEEQVFDKGVAEYNDIVEIGDCRKPLHSCNKALRSILWSEEEFLSLRSAVRTHADKVSARILPNSPAGRTRNRQIQHGK